MAHITVWGPCSSLRGLHALGPINLVDDEGQPLPLEFCIKLSDLRHRARHRSMHLLHGCREACTLGLPPFGSLNAHLCPTILAWVCAALGCLSALLEGVSQQLPLSHCQAGRCARPNTPCCTACLMHVCSPFHVSSQQPSCPTKPNPVAAACSTCAAQHLSRTKISHAAQDACLPRAMPPLQEHSAAIHRVIMR